MSENNVVMQGAPAAPKKNNTSTIVFLVMILIGVIVLVVGVVLFKNTDARKSLKLKDYSESYSAAGVKRFDLDISWADLTVSRSSDDNIYVDAKNVPEDFKAGVNGDTFFTDFTKKKMSLHMLPSWLSGDESNTVVEIKLPEQEYESFVLDLGAGEAAVSDINFGKFRVEGGAGEITFENIDCETGSFECGAGEVNIKGMNCMETLYVDGGTGEIDITNSVLGGIKVEQGVGEFNFSGTINGDIDIDGGVGEINVNLTNPESDFVGSGSKYKLDVDTGIGSKSIHYGVSH